ncbi:probable galacturonosyltransferase 15 isoform X1 [Typha angustifolia]|uniref:probable galacturonosyltransferase 15 isoform X1 n=1 Tax=Typha angustifolia TaxID=59011 RepID=UPI003C2ED66F
MRSLEVMKAKGMNRRYSYRSVLLAVLVAGILLRFLFMGTALLALDAGASVCPSVSCLNWRLGIWPRLFTGSDSSLQELIEELRRSYLDGSIGGRHIDPTVVEAAPESMDHLIAEMGSLSSYDQLDIDKFVLKTKAMLLKMDQKVQSARLQAFFYQRLASVGIPKSMHCLGLRLAEEYAVNAAARSSLPPADYASRLTSVSYLHIVLLTDNILAAYVAIASTRRSSVDPEKLVFHIITDKKSYAAMHAWFALHPVSPAIVEVKGLHHFDLPAKVSASVMKTIDEIHQSSSDYHHLSGNDRHYRRLEALKPSTFSILNYLKIHLPEFFPKLNRVIFLDDDVVVRRDLTQLWVVDLSGSVMGAVGVQGKDNTEGSLCIEKKLGEYFNFSNPTASLQSLGLRRDQCAWSWGVNLFNLQAWRRTNITETYQYWLRKNRESELALWHMGSLPPALIAFNGQVHPIESSWHLSGLGWQEPNLELLESAAVLHFSGPGKPWLEIGYPVLREMWQAHFNRSDELLRSCGLVE